MIDVIVIVAIIPEHDQYQLLRFACTEKRSVFWHFYWMYVGFLVLRSARYNKNTLKYMSIRRNAAFSVFLSTRWKIKCNYFPFFSSYQYGLFLIQLIVNKSLPMIGFEPRISGEGSDHYTNWATTTATFTYLICGIRVVWCYQGSS